MSSIHKEKLLKWRVLLVEEINIHNTTVWQEDLQASMTESKNMALRQIAYIDRLINQSTLNQCSATLIPTFASSNSQ